ncbi:MAG: hypothetical protein HY066_15750 [Betaproteobacteria bacterium]|nr:hypothetical protein [Betaproteobacteria bacterium]
MKLLALFFPLLGVLGAVGIALPARAQQDARRGAEFAQGGSMHASPGRGVQKTAGENSGRQLSGDGSSNPRASGQKANEHERLSPEERRQLRRDINAAGRDIYHRSGP